MKRNVRAGLERIAASSGLTAFEKAIFLERVEAAANSPTALLELERQAGDGRLGGALMVAVTGLRSELAGDPLPFGGTDEEEEELARAEFFGRIEKMRAAGDTKGADALRAALAEAEQEEAQMVAGRRAREEAIRAAEAERVEAAREVAALRGGTGG